MSSRNVRRRGISPRLVQAVVRIPEDWHRRINERARMEGKPASAYLRDLIYPLIDDDAKSPLSEPPRIGRPRR